MVSSVILIECEKGKINQVAEALADLKGITEVYSVAGRIDLVAIVRVVDNDHLAAIVTEQILKIVGINRTETLIAFRVFSKHDLEAMFSIGFEQS